MLESFGHQLSHISPKIVKYLGDALYNLRPSRNRIIYFYCDENNKYVLLHGFKKTIQKTPTTELDKAKKEMKEYERIQYEKNRNKSEIN